MSAEIATLIGKKVVSVEIAEDRGAIRIVADGTEYIGRCDGDCCSYTWIEGIEGLDNLIGGVVSAIEEIDMPANIVSKYVENPNSIANYGLKITTDKGHFILDYRNDSNGYYGGHISWIGGYFYGGVHGQNVSKLKWQPAVEN